MKLLNKINISFLLCLITSALLAQDIHFSQTFNTPLVLNPSYCGDFDGQVRALDSYKYQWSSVSNKPYKTFFFSLDKPFYGKKINAGLIFFNDKAGDSEMSTTQADLDLSSQITAGDKDKVSVGIQFGLGQRKFDGRNLVWDAQWDGNTFNNALPSNEPVLSNSFGYFDLSSGMGWHHKFSDINKLRIGVAAYHLNRPAFSFIYDNKERLYIKSITSASWELKLKKLSNTTYIATVGWYKQGTADELNFSLIARQELGMNSLYTGNNVSSNLLFGGVWRWNDAVAPYVGYEYKKGLSAGISYDINYSGLRKASYAHGGFELHLSYRFVGKNIIVETTAPSTQ
ncbi:MAG TPA: PorP/SprF family type IX secretion system membrane protein [Bacteroidia bacterium]